MWSSVGLLQLSTQLPTTTLFSLGPFLNSSTEPRLDLTLDLAL